MTDQIEKISNSVIQHGNFNNRIYLMDLDTQNVEQVIQKCDKIATENAYTKIIVKAPEGFKEAFLEAGYEIEASIPKFYHGKENMYFMAKFFNDTRQIQKHPKRASRILVKAISRRNKRENIELDDSYEFRILGPDDAVDMARVFKKTFETYPFPVFDCDYLIETMDSHVIYFGVWHHGKLVAISSCEMYEKKSNVEMTDFAILEKFRGKKLSLFLLNEMEKVMKERNIKTAYSMSRAQSYGMNITLAKFGYRYGGTVINNANLGGGIESLNIWYKSLSD